MPRTSLALALQGAGSLPTSDQLISLRLRADNAITHFIEMGRIRRIGDDTRTGWVWSDREISDEEWLRRAGAPPEPPISIVRFSAPEACVVVIGPKKDADS